MTRVSSVHFLIAAVKVVSRVIRHKQVVSLIIKFLTWQLSIEHTFLTIHFHTKSLCFSFHNSLLLYNLDNFSDLPRTALNASMAEIQKWYIEAVERSCSSNKNRDTGLPDQQGARKLVTWASSLSWEGRGWWWVSSQQPWMSGPELESRHSVLLWSLPR